MSEMELDVSVVICAYTEARWEDLIAAVASVRQQQVQPAEIIVVVDHSQRLLNRVRTHIPDVVALENRETRGLSGARNTGVAAARGAIVAFLDDDAVAAPDWLARLRAGYDDPQVLGVGGAIKPRWLRRRPKWFPEEFNWVVGCTYRGMPEERSTVRNLIGANMSFRRDVFTHVGGFRTGIGRVNTRPVGCEETELCIRICQRWPEGRLLYEPAATVHHRVPASRAQWSYFRSRCYAEGLSKALVSRCVGSRDGLATERQYTFQTLPRGVARSAAAALNGDLSGLARAGTIVAGFTITTFGYAMGIAAERLGVSSELNPVQTL